MSFLSKLYQISIDRAVDTPGHGKDVVDGFNAVYIIYLATFLIMSSTSEEDNIDSKYMHVDAMTEKVKVSVALECKHLLDLQDEIGNKGDRKHAKQESEARLKHKYYW